MAEKEYIERKAAYKACEAYFSGVCVYDVSESEVINDFEKVIDALPTADVVPVVHCKNCEYNNECSVQDFGEMHQNDFCSRGKRRSDNG